MLNAECGVHIVHTSSMQNAVTFEFLSFRTYLFFHGELVPLAVYQFRELQIAKTINETQTNTQNNMRRSGLFQKKNKCQRKRYKTKKSKKRLPLFSLLRNNNDTEREREKEKGGDMRYSLKGNFYEWRMAFLIVMGEILRVLLGWLVS